VAGDSPCSRKWNRPPGRSTRRIVEGGAEGYYLTLSVYEIDGAIEGTRAEWSVYTDDGDGRPNLMIIDLMTQEVSIDPVSIINLPSVVDLELVGGVLSTRLSSAAVTFEASFETASATDEELSLDWIEAGDIVCHLNGICDNFFYDAETLDVPVRRPAEVAVETFSTPWSEFIEATPSVVFYRDNAQEYVVKRWYTSLCRSTSCRSAAWRIGPTPSLAAGFWSDEPATSRTRTTPTPAMQCWRATG